MGKWYSLGLRKKVGHRLCCVVLCYSLLKVNALLSIIKDEYHMALNYCSNLLDRIEMYRSTLSHVLVLLLLLHRLCQNLALIASLCLIP